MKTTHTDTHRDLAIGLVCVALGMDPENTDEVSEVLRHMTEDTPSSLLRPDATFTVRRDVEYIASEDCSPNYAAPQDSEQMGWMRSGDEEVIESDWSGSDQMVRAYRWDLYSVNLDTLGLLAYQNLWDSGSAETMAGYLDADGMHPSCSITSDGMDWNQGGWTPVYIASDYVVLD